MSTGIYYLHSHIAGAGLVQVLAVREQGGNGIICLGNRVGMGTVNAGTCGDGNSGLHPCRSLG